MIVYLHQANADGAVEHYLEQLLRGLDEKAVFVAPRSVELERIRDLAELRPFDPSLGTAGRFWHLVRELRRTRPRLVHVVDVWPLAFLAAWTARVPRVVVTHHTPELPRNDNAIGRILWRLGWATRPEVIYTSEADRTRDGRAGVVIPLGIDLGRFDVQRRPAGIVGTVARLVEQKGLDTLVDAAPHVLRSHPDVRFVVVGDGPLRDQLARRAMGLPFEFVGQRDDIPTELARFDVFALPSRFEGLCLAVIEAQAAGVPVVATPVGGIVETVVDGKTGLLVPVDEPEELATALSRLLDDRDLAGKLGANARERVRERFSLAAMLDKTFTFYN
jgi:glycosyltransferase involved in cell wall biosynthesis